MAGFTAATISYFGLVKFFGTDGEKINGIMVVPSVSDWSRRAASPTGTPWPADVGPTGPGDGITVANEWWAVWNYLKYNVGACLVGATGSATNTQYGYTYSSLHSSANSFDVAFSAGNTHSSETVAHMASSRGDMYGIIGSIKGITQPVPAGYTNDHLKNDFGITYYGITGVTAGTNIVYVANRKTFFLDWKNIGSVSTTGSIDMASDVVGCFGRLATQDSIWSIPAGLQRGNILSALALAQAYTATDTTNLQDNGVNIVTSFPGKGTYFMGNSTGAALGGYPHARGYMNVVSIINYIKKEIKGIALEYLYEPNTEANRTQFAERAKTVLSNIERAGNITSVYNVYMDPAKNTGQTFTAEITITPIAVAENITLQVTNNGAVVETFVI
jgi:hypothetical protein